MHTGGGRLSNRPLQLLDLRDLTLTMDWSYSILSCDVTCYLYLHTKFRSNRTSSENGWTDG